MNENENERPRGNKKNISFLGQIFGALWIAGWCIHLFAFSGHAYTVSDIVLSAGAIVAMFSPVYLSIILDKIREIRTR